MLTWIFIQLFKTECFYACLHDSDLSLQDSEKPVCALRHTPQHKLMIQSQDGQTCFLWMRVENDSRERSEARKGACTNHTHAAMFIHAPSFLVGSVSGFLLIHQQLSHRSRLTKKWALRGKTPWLSHMGIASRLWLSAVICHAFILTLSNNLCRRMG